MRCNTAVLALGVVLAGVSAKSVAAQGVAITPQIGVYIPASDFYELRDEADVIRVEKEGTLALGFTLDLGMLRGTVLYATGAQLNERGVSNQDDIGEGSLLTAAADLVIRPLPRVLVQPYLLGGVGIKNASYDPDEGFDDAFPEDDTEWAAHIGLGVDLVLGNLGIVAEISDFISRDPDGDWGVHDAFAMVGLKLRLGGR